VIEIEEKTPMSRRQDLIEAVILVQKHLETPTDIVTFCGRKGVRVAEIEWHLEYCVRRVQKETAIARTSRILRPSSIDDRIAASVSGAPTVIGADISARTRILRRRATRASDQARQRSRAS
jgi:hypothetical protein